MAAEGKYNTRVPGVLASLFSLFGHGDDDHPLWLLAVRANILLLLGACLVAALLSVGQSLRVRLAGRAGRVGA
ncbi:MAG: hypothetical protein ACRELB_24105, partial [Polyangiaceae bacterium]